jgi:hypothetical protein
MNIFSIHFDVNATDWSLRSPAWHALSLRTSI